MPKIFTPSSRQEWLTLRSEDVTSTEVSALFELSPYTTPFELWHQKRDKTIVTIEENERMKWGTRLQDAIAAGIAEDYGWRIARFDNYLRHDTQRGMGASFDFEVWCPERGDGILEIKNVDFIQHRNKWIDDDEDSEAPEHIELQLQQQLEITGRSWGAIGALVAGNQCKVIIRDRDVELGRKLCQSIESFWMSIDAGMPPEPNYAKDGAQIKKLYSDASGAPKIIHNDNHLTSLMAKYKEGSALEKTAKEMKESAKNEALTLIGNSPKVICGNYTISATTVNKDAYMVKAQSYRDFRVTEKKK